MGWDGMTCRTDTASKSPEYSGVGVCGISSERPLAGHTHPTICHIKKII